jgi:hypothetical protein
MDKCLQEIILLGDRYRYSNRAAAFIVTIKSHLSITVLSWLIKLPILFNATGFNNIETN